MTHGGLCSAALADVSEPGSETRGLQPRELLRASAAAALHDVGHVSKAAQGFAAMGCGASKKAAYAAPQIASGPSWIQRQNGISIDDAIAQLREDLKIKANLSDPEILEVARQQRGLQDVEGNLREKIYHVAVEYGIWTGWETDAVDVWVGSIPASQATKGKLKALFEQYGRIVNVTVRYKPRSALNPDNNKSWAVLTFTDKRDSSRALRAETFVPDDEGQPHKLKVSPQEVERNRAMRANEENGPGKMEDMVAHQQKEVEKRLTSKGGRKKGVKVAGGGQDGSGMLAAARQQVAKLLMTQMLKAVGLGQARTASLTKSYSLLRTIARPFVPNTRSNSRKNAGYSFLSALGEPICLPKGRLVATLLMLPVARGGCAALVCRVPKLLGGSLRSASTFCRVAQTRSRTISPASIWSYAPA